MIFKTPLVLLLVPLVFVIAYVLFRKQKPAAFRFPSQSLVQIGQTSLKVQLRFVPTILRYACLVLFIVALAGPRSVSEETIHTTEGIDIVLAIDTSGSMAAEDFKKNGKRINRLRIVKDVVTEFIDKRPSDQIGLIAFAGVAYTVCPLTTDYSWLQTNLERIELGLIKDGTAIGSAIASSVARLGNSEAKSKIIVLLTDGVSNAGEIDPATAAKIARTKGIKIYTIGAATKGFAPFPTQDMFGRTVYRRVKIELDEEVLQEVADISGGQYFRATDTEELRKIYDEIDKLEKTEIEQHGYIEYIESFDKFLLVGLLLLGIEILLRNTLLIKVP